MPRNNSEYFQIYCELAKELMSHKKKDSPAVKYILRHVIRSATNTSSNLPSYDNKLGAKYMSAAAYEQMQKGDFSNLVGEHVVPISVILMLIEEKSGKPNTNRIKEIVEDYSLKAVITKQEDKLLKSLGLTKKMPDNWNRKNLNARYQAVGIKLIDNKYQELKSQYG